MDRIGDHSILGKLGEGAHGVVYRASDAQGRIVALKLLHGRHGDDLDLRARFDRECRLGESIHDPHVVGSYAHGEHQGRAWLATELVDGGSLGELLERGRLDGDRTLRVAEALFSGLAAIHAHGLVHRDIKPANLLFDKAGTLKVADLGLARPTEIDRTRMTIAGSVIGTPAYIAPEQIEHGDQVDIRADLYSAGVVLYECLTGDLPFTADTVVDLLRAHLAQPPRTLLGLSGIPQPLAQFVHRLLEKDPANRFPDPASALAEVRDLLREDGRTMPELSADAGPAGALARSFAATISAEDLPTSDSGTISGMGLTLASEPAVLELTPTGNEVQPSALLAATAADGDRLFCYAGPTVTLGRDAPRHDPRQLCLRLFPAAAEGERSLRLSSRHAELSVSTSGVTLGDLGGAHGTTVDGRALHGSTTLTDGAVICLAGVLTLLVRILPPAAAIRVARHACEPAAPSVLLLRQENGQQHRYLLVGAAVALDHPLLHAGTGLLLAAGGGLWRPMGSSAVPLRTPPTPFRPITPDDHKG